MNTVSIITAVMNGGGTIEDAITSVEGQSFEKIEHIIVDGGSTDNTLDVIKRHEKCLVKWISEPDRGIYDAMNKGLMLATGDIIGILNSDDLYADDAAIEDVMNTLWETRADSCYGDLVYVDKEDTAKVIRYWRSGDYRRERFKRGWMPPHPTFFVRRAVYQRYGLLNTDFPLAADYELMLRLLYKFKISTVYIPRVLVKMRTGGASAPGMYTPRALLENYRAWKVNGLHLNPLALLLKPLSKLSQYITSRDI